MTRYDVKIEPMPDNPITEERGLGRKSGLYCIEIWELVSTTNFKPNYQFKMIAKENLTYEDAQIVQMEMLNSLNAQPVT